MIQFFIWMFRQRGKRLTQIENDVIRDAFNDPDWDGKKLSLKMHILQSKDDAAMDAFNKLVLDYQSYNSK